MSLDKVQITQKAFFSDFLSSYDDKFAAVNIIFIKLSFCIFFSLVGHLCLQIVNAHTPITNLHHTMYSNITFVYVLWCTQFTKNLQLSIELTLP